MKRPAFQFYPADWRKDPALSTCSLAARGLWIELVCIAHESDEYGVLSIAGKAMTVQQIARAVGESPAVVQKLLAELEDSGVFSRNEQGCILSRRMVRDEHIRNVRADAGRLGGNPNLLKQKDKQSAKQTDNQSPTPSSSSSSSSSETPPKPPKGADVHGFPPGFDAFWAVYPKKVGKDAAAKAFAKRKPDAALVAVMVEAVKRQAASPQWAKDGGQFIPNPATWLNQGRWQDEDGGSGGDTGTPWEGAA